MDQNSFIFSEKKTDRIKRHLLFWVAWYFYLAITHGANPGGSPEISYFKNPVFTFTEITFILLAQVPVIYAMLYVVLPLFLLKKKYLIGSVAIVFLWFLCGVLNFYFLRDVLPRILSVVLHDGNLANTQRTESATFFMAVIATNKGAFTITASALMLKFVKYWYLKQQHNLRLQKENSEAQLQLLTAQVHPHFLFNTLNNIYSQAQTESPKSSKMIMGLSDMLRYILYEGQKPLVPLSMELLMIDEYINLEKIRYGNKLDVHVVTSDKTDEIYIAPLLLLPFVENCFKHGTSSVLQKPWINLTVEMKDTMLVMKLMNGKASFKNKTLDAGGLGINNVRQRLELLYKGDHDLQITEDDEVFVVDLKVKLIRIKSQEPLASPVSLESNLVYN